MLCSGIRFQRPFYQLTVTPKYGCGVAQVVEHPLSKHEALSSSPNIIPFPKKRKEKNRKRKNEDL
jgi:hypothetical protein